MVVCWSVSVGFATKCPKKTSPRHLFPKWYYFLQTYVPTYIVFILGILPIVFLLFLHQLTTANHIRRQMAMNKKESIAISLRETAPNSREMPCEKHGASLGVMCKATKLILKIFCIIRHIFSIVFFSAFIKIFFFRFVFFIPFSNIIN